jgi:hypothetical protein
MKHDADQYVSMFDVVMKYAGILMSSIYVLAGIAVLSRSRELFNLPQQYVVPLGLALILYGVFRGFRLYQKYFRKRP